jgi:putative ATP-binding cassette transporter
MPKFFQFLLRESPGGLVSMVAAGLLSGACSAGILAVINRFLHRTDAPTTVLFALFVALVAGKVISNALSQFLLVRFSQGAILDLSLALCRRMTQAPLQFLERKGKAELLTTLTDDVSWVVWAIQCIPQLVMNGAVLIGCGFYLAWLSWTTFVGVVAVTLLGALGYYLLHRRTFAVIYAAREARSALFGHFRSLIEGMKELLMGQRRREEFVDGAIRSTAAEYRRINLAATSNQAQLEAWTQMMFYVMIGLLLFVFADVVNLPPESLTGYVFAMLYMMNPLWGLIGSFPTISRGQHALAKIEQLGISLSSIHTEESPERNHPRRITGKTVLTLKAVSFAYEQGREGKHFCLGPVDFELSAGEVVFVVGGNGSGKSTFVKVLTGLYAPQQGEVWLDGHRIAASEWAWYREQFAVVFSDFFLFDTLYGVFEQDVERKGPAFLRLLQMDHKVSLMGRKFSTTDLSQGQRKRLALVTAFLEDRPFYVFDEWAADQDPQYKEIFYKTVLPDLRSQGKAVVVITHDERYFYLGDRVVKLDEGNVVDTWRPGTTQRLRMLHDTR